MSSPQRAWQPVTLGAEFPPPAGAYSPAVRAGDLVFLSGQVPRDLKTGTLVGDDVETQTRQTLANVATALAAAGATMEDVVAMTVYLADIGDWARFNEVYKATLRPPYPTRAVVGAALHGFLVEISAIAVVKRG